MHNIYIFWGRNHYHMKKEEIYKWVLHYFFQKFQKFQFGNVSWCTNMRPYGCRKNVDYIFYVHCFLSHPLHLTIKSKWTLNSKMLPCNFLKTFIVFKIVKRCHQDFNLYCTMILVIHYLFWWKCFNLILFWHVGTNGNENTSWSK